MFAESVHWKTKVVVLASLMVTIFSGAVAARGEVLPEGESSFQGHPADVDKNWRLVMSEAIAYLAGWQGGSNSMTHAIRAAYLWQNGEGYMFDSAQVPPMCWMPPDPEEGEPVIVPPELVDVPAGTFQMGDPWNEGVSVEVPVHTVYLDAYRIGKYEVTNQEYADVLNWVHGQRYLTNSSGGAYTGGPVYAYGQLIANTENSSSSQLIYSDGMFGVRSREGHGGALYSMAVHPVVEVSWYGAVCYCNWLSERQGLQPCYDTSTWTRFEPVRNGYRLPTEAEWERAAAWDSKGDGRHWRYSMTNDTIDITRANYYDWEYTGEFANPLGLTSYPYTAPVGWYNGVNPARVSVPDTLTKNATSPVGAYDMSGNVWEWCHDWYGAYTSDDETNPLGPSTGTDRISRGGSWNPLMSIGYPAVSETRSAMRGWIYPFFRFYEGGFRVVVSVL